MAYIPPGGAFDVTVTMVYIYYTNHNHIYTTIYSCVELPIISDSNKTTEREKSIGTERV